MKTKTTIITLAALSLGVAATQAGRGNVLVVPGADSQTQHASHAVHTFNLGDVWAYKITGYSYTLKTMDSSSSRNTYINVTSNGHSGEVFDIQIPLERKVEKTDEVVFGSPIILSGDNLNLVYSWEHGASAFGTIALSAEILPTAPDIQGDLDVPSVATADSKPTVSWEALISFTDK